MGEATQDGQPFFVGIIHDLTEREKHRNAPCGETALRLQATVVATAVDGVILIDAQGTIQMFNPACERLFGYFSSEITGQNVKVLMPAPFHGEHDQYLRNFRETGERKIIGIGRSEVVGRRKDGIHVPDGSVRGGGQTGGRVHFSSESFTTLPSASAPANNSCRRKKWKLWGRRFSGGIAHDFNNLLTVIILVIPGYYQRETLGTARFEAVLRHHRGSRHARRGSDAQAAGFQQTAGTSARDDRLQSAD